ncbi:MAG: ArsR/SmtB family transcription factor [Longimicrobiales bacterium]
MDDKTAPDHRGLKGRLYEQFARVGKALASPARLELLDLLSQGERSVEGLAGEAALTVKNTSAHLRVLWAARLVERRKVPPYVLYSLAGDEVFGLVRELQTLSRGRLAEVDRLARLYFEARDTLEPIGLGELRRRVAVGDVVVLDVRPAAEYAAGHVAGAWSVPVEELERRLAELPGDREVIAYCRGPYCLFSLDAVELLRRHGIAARRLAGGFPDWRMAGFPVSAGVADEGEDASAGAGAA